MELERKEYIHKLKEYKKQISEFNYSDKLIVFDNYYLTLNKLMGSTGLKKFKNSFKSGKDYIVPKLPNNKIKYEPQTNPLFICIAAQILASYLIAPEEYIEYLTSQKTSHLRNSKEQLEYFHLLKNVDWKLFYFLTYNTIIYKAKDNAIKHLLPKEEVTNESFLDLKFQEDFRQIKLLLETQIEKYGLDEKSTTIIHPQMGSEIVGIKSNGDFIFDEYLIDFKLSINNSFNKTYINSLIANMCLNKIRGNIFSIRGFGYWNPLYDIYIEVDYQIQKDLCGLFLRQASPIINNFRSFELHNNGKIVVDKINAYIQNKKIAFESLKEFTHKIEKFLEIIARQEEIQKNLDQKYKSKW